MTNMPAIHTENRITLRLAENEDDLQAAQRLRWRVFYAEMGAASDPSALLQMDADEFDILCDHLLVIDEARPKGDQVIGTYRLLRESVARRHHGFYSAREFDLAPLANQPGAQGELLELGRSCILPEYRTSATISLLWRGIADYIARHDIRLMFGCASFSGADPDSHAPALSYLYHRHLADEPARPQAHANCFEPLERLADGSYDERRAMMALPPLIKGYLRVGAKVGDGAFIDRQFNTVDVCIVMPVVNIAQRYLSRFSCAA
jgi:putative hemolysin